MKRRNMILCIGTIIATLNMNSAISAQVELNGNQITVVSEGKADEWGTLVVVKSGNTMEDSNIVSMKQALADENGQLTFNFAISDAIGDSVNGKYDLYIKNESEVVRIDNMYYSREVDRNSLINSIRSAATATELNGILSNVDNSSILRSIGINMDNYLLIVQKDIENSNTAYEDNMCNIFIEYCQNSTLTDQEIVEALNASVLIELINISEVANAELIKNLGFEFEGKKYKDLTDDSCKNFINEYVFSNRTYSSLNGAKHAYETANILYIINNTRFDKLETIFGKYAEGLGISGESAYISYKNAVNKSDINEDIASELKTTPAKSVSALISVIDKSVKNNPYLSGGNIGGITGGNISGNAGGNASGNAGGNTNSFTLFPTVSRTSIFDDLETVSWAETAINALAEQGIVAGDENGKFNPNNNVKREEFVKMLVAASGMYDEYAECTFKDVTEDAWYYRYIASATSNGLVYGVSEKEFGVGTEITRQDMAVMCYRAAKATIEIPQIRNDIAFNDSDRISDYAKEAVSALYKANVVNGVGNNEFSPIGTATRAQAAVMIYNLFIK